VEVDVHVQYKWYTNHTEATFLCYRVDIISNRDCGPFVLRSVFSVERSAASGLRNRHRFERRIADLKIKPKSDMS
jgi:hypothetical protein